MSTVTEPAIQHRTAPAGAEPWPVASPPGRRWYAGNAPLPWLAGSATSCIAAALVGGGAPQIWLTALAAAIVLGLATLTLPRYERRFSARPAKAVSVATLVAVSVCGLAGLPASYLRPQMMVAGIGALAAACAGGMSRRWRRRVAVLCGSGSAVTEFLAVQPAAISVAAICRTDAGRGMGAEPSPSKIPVVHGLASVVDVALATGADTVVWLGQDGAGPGPLRALGWRIERTDLELVVASPLHGVATDRVASERVGDQLVLTVRPSCRQPVTALAKRVIDLTVATVLLVLATAPLLCVAALIRLESRGPALFRQQRVGRDGKTFTLYKLRTMSHDAEAKLADLTDHNEASGPLFKMQHDPRITKVGRILRRSSVDELPQLLNVLTGRMSLIGPRPALPSEVAAYDAAQARRLAVLPGMTGLWQVSGRSSLSWEQSVALDNFYADNWTVGRDLGIAARTVRAVLSASGAM